MKKDEIERLTAYKEKLLDRLDSPVPDKHKGHKVEFKRWLKNEISLVESKINKLNLGA